MRTKQRMNRCLVCIGLFAVCMYARVSAAGNLGQFGKVYAIAEKDGITEMQELASQVDVAALQKQALADYRRTMNGTGFSEVHLKRAKADASRQVDMTYTLDIDIPDPKDLDRIMYPKGFRFNPLQYIDFTSQVLFIDMGDKKQVAWLKKSKLLDRDDLIIVLTGGGYEKTAKQLGRPFSYATTKLIDRFKINVVPSLAFRNGDNMEVREYAPL